MDLYREFFENAYFEPNTISKHLMGNKQCLKEFLVCFFCLRWERSACICISKGGRGSGGKGEEVDYRS